ncbi:hypothetical protein HPB47_021449, partial [Ixodes persulcatus]
LEPQTSLAVGRRDVFPPHSIPSLETPAKVGKGGRIPEAQTEMTEKEGEEDFGFSRQPRPSTRKGQKVRVDLPGRLPPPPRANLDGVPLFPPRPSDPFPAASPPLPPHPRDKNSLCGFSGQHSRQDALPPRQISQCGYGRRTTGRSSSSSSWCLGVPLRRTLLRTATRTMEVKKSRRGCSSFRTRTCPIPAASASLRWALLGAACLTRSAASSSTTSSWRGVRCAASTDGCPSSAVPNRARASATASEGASGEEEAEEASSSP